MKNYQVFLVKHARFGNESFTIGLRLLGLRWW